MYSIRGDTVLDPFVGTGTTSLAAMLAGRSAVGVERDPALAAAFAEPAAEAPDLSRDLAGERLRRHREFIADNPENANYEATHYDTRVVTQSEREIRLSTVADVERTADSPLRVRATHEPY
jgi:site-specific DNA-methyltransferase (cytosine-N4-specific)